LPNVRELTALQSPAERSTLAEGLYCQEDIVMHMVMFVLDDPDQLDAVLDAWDAIGVSGVTIAETSGINRRRVQRKRIPARFAIGQFVEGDQQNSYTLFTIVRDENVAQQCLGAAETVVGDLDTPSSGVLAAWPLTIIKGVPMQDVNGDRE
jgi:hypothetical protein